ncbi:hypothetical protein ACHWQZ_G004800 [Mnemiopsis leidyi]
MGCGCSVPDPRIDVPRAFSSRGQYQNIFDGVETDSISLSAFDVDTESQCSSVNVCEIDEIRPLFSRSDDFKEIEREPVRYSASFKRNRPPSMKYEAISGTFPPVSVANYQPSPTHIPVIRIDHASTSSSNAVASEPMSRLDSNTCLMEKTLSRHIAPIDSLELIPGMNKNVTESALLEKISPPRIAFERKMVQDLSATSSLENNVDENEIGENGLERNASCLVIGKTQSMLSISQSSPNIAAVQKIAEKLVILRKDTNENLRSKASKKEIVPVSGYTVEDERQFVVSAKGLEQGVTVVGVTATYTESSGRVISLTDTISIEVIRKVQLLSPVSPEIPDLLLGPGSAYNIRTNKDHSHTVHYSVLHGSDVLAIGTDGTVKAEKLGTAALKIDVLEDHNVNQTILLNVQVKTPFALLLEESVAPSSKKLSEYPYHTLPMGLTTSFIVKTKDDLGRQFDSISKSSYFYTLNRLDVISVESVGSNSSLSLTGSSVGEAIVRVYTDTGLEGWSYVRVSSPLDVPVFTLLHLSTVCIQDLIGEGEWSSRDPTIATVKGGLVRGENLGVTELRKQISSTFSIIKVEVVKIESVTLSLSPNTPALSNLASSRTFSSLVLPVSIATTKPLSDLPATCGSKQDIKIKFQCVSSHPSVVTAAPDLERRACVVTALSNAAVTSLSPLVTVQLDGAVSSSIKIPFVPRFKLAGDKVSLSPENPTADISLLEGDISLVQVILDERALEDLNIIKTSSNFHVSLLNWNSNTVHSISFTCSVTGQQEVYKVVIVPSQPSPVPTTPIKLQFSDLVSTLLPTALLGLLVLLIVIGIVFLTTASYRRLQFTSSPSNTSHLGKSDFPSPAKSIGSPFRPASLTASPSRLKTPLYTKPRGTPGSV